MEMLGDGNEQIKTALLLAAGTGSRLQPLTDDLPKCLTSVSGITILERLVRGLEAWKLDRLVVVVGHLDVCLRNFLDSLVSPITFQYIYSDRYLTTNNIYSLWSARNAIQDPFLLLECDLVFDEALLGEMLVPDRIAVSRTLPWMNGTKVSLDRQRRVTRFHMSENERPVGPTFKTVNMYSFSRSAWLRVARRLDQYVSAGRVGMYYETVLAELVADKTLSFEAVFFDNRRWYEIDKLEDLWEAERLFPKNDGPRDHLLSSN